MSVIPATFRSRVRAGVEPIARLFGRVGLTPNMLTLIGFAIAVAAAVAAAGQAYLWAGLLVAFGAVFDLFDGALARATNRVSKFGAFMDSTFDRASEAVVYIGIASVFAASGWTVAVIVAMTAMAAAQMVSYARAKSESLGFSPGAGMANIGLAPREVRMAILVIGLIAAGVLPEPPAISCIFPCPQALGPAWIVLATLGLVAVLSTITTIQRIFFVYRQSKSQEVSK